MKSTNVFLILCLILISSPVFAEKLLDQNTATAAKSFELNDFGLQPSPQMTCIKGPCLDSKAEEIFKPSRTIVSSYLKPIDVTTFGGVPISSPRYDYYQNENFRIAFEIICDYENTDACIDQIVERLIVNYGMKNLDNLNIFQNKENEILTRYLGVDSEVLARITWVKRNNVWGNPAVKIYKKDLIDKVRLAANPHYVSK